MDLINVILYHAKEKEVHRGSRSVFEVLTIPVPTARLLSPERQFSLTTHFPLAGGVHA